MPTCDMLKNSQYVQNLKIGTSNPITHFRKLQKQALLLLDTDKPSGNQLNKIYLCKSFTTYLSIWPICNQWYRLIITMKYFQIVR